MMAYYGHFFLFRGLEGPLVSIHFNHFLHVRARTWKQTIPTEKKSLFFSSKSSAFPTGVPERISQRHRCRFEPSRFAVFFGWFGGSVRSASVPPPLEVRSTFKGRCWMRGFVVSCRTRRPSDWLIDWLTLWMSELEEESWHQQYLEGRFA